MGCCKTTRAEWFGTVRGAFDLERRCGRRILSRNDITNFARDSFNVDRVRPQMLPCRGSLSNFNIARDFVPSHFYVWPTFVKAEVACFMGCNALAANIFRSWEEECGWLFVNRVFVCTCHMQDINVWKWFISIGGGEGHRTNADYFTTFCRQRSIGTFRPTQHCRICSQDGCWRMIGHFDCLIARSSGHRVMEIIVVWRQGSSRIIMASWSISYWHVRVIIRMLSKPNPMRWLSWSSGIKPDDVWDV